MTDSAPRCCPVCGEAFTQQSVGDVEIDVCESHGVWLDKGELEAIQERVTQRGLRMRRRAVKRASTQGRNEGWMLGPLAHLFD